jgi:hypothetical protein
MANTTALHKLLRHPDRDEIISKLCMGISAKQTYEWLSVKYSNASEKQFVIAEKSLKSFQDNYLDVYQVLREEFSNAKIALATGTSAEQLSLAVSENLSYKALVAQTVGQELDLKKAIGGLIAAIELRLGQVFDAIQEDPRNVNSRVDRVLIEYVDKLGSLIEKAHKVINNGPDQIVQHNITVQHIDQHISIFYEAIKRVLTKMDLESSMYFMELFNEEMNKLKDPNNRPIQPVEERLAEVKILNETINQKLNE